MRFFVITDDSGFLGIFNPQQYISFVDEDWEFDQLITHFKHQILHKNLLLWGSGSEGTWKVGINDKLSGINGFREIEGTIEVTDGKLCLINYESLTMGAMFTRVTLPEEHLRDCVFELSNGFYKCRIIQMNNPEEVIIKSEVDFIIEFSLTDSKFKPWNRIPWFESEFN
jgi:hypothetical protein